MSLHPELSMGKVLTVLEGKVVPEREAALKAAYRAAAEGPFPPGLLRSSLLRATADPGAWRITTLWDSAEALHAMRAMGTPRGLLIFRAAGAEPTLSILEVVDELEPS